MNKVVMTSPQPQKYFAQRFALWLALCAMFMMFAGWTSALLVRRAQSGWLEFNMPKEFYMSTLVIIVSSITMIIANHQYKNDNYKSFRRFLALTFFLGMVFSVLQYLGWQSLDARGIPMGGENANVSGSFVHLISRAHLLHLLGGLFFMFIALIRAMYIFKNPANSLQKNINPTKGIRMDLLSTYWHFVDVLWIYLFLFFMINK